MACVALSLKVEKQRLHFVFCLIFKVEFDLSIQRLVQICLLPQLSGNLLQKRRVVFQCDSLPVVQHSQVKSQDDDVFLPQIVRLLAGCDHLGPVFRCDGVVLVSVSL